MFAGESNIGSFGLEAETSWAEVEGLRALDLFWGEYDTLGDAKLIRGWRL